MQQDPALENATELPPAINPQIQFSWKAPLRPYKKQTGKVMRFYLAVCFLLSVSILLLGDAILLVPMWALLFLFYVLTITPPPEAEHSISKFGIQTAGISVRWDALSHFFFTRRFGYDVVNLVGQAPFYPRAYIVVPSEYKESILHLLAEHIVYQHEPEFTFTDRLIDLLAKLVPEESDEKSGKIENTAAPIVPPYPAGQVFAR